MGICPEFGLSLIQQAGALGTSPAFSRVQTTTIPRDLIIPASKESPNNANTGRHSLKKLFDSRPTTKKSPQNNTNKVEVDVADLIKSESGEV